MYDDHWLYCPFVSLFDTPTVINNGFSNCSILIAIQEFRNCLINSTITSACYHMNVVLDDVWVHPTKTSVSDHSMPCLQSCLQLCKHECVPSKHRYSIKCAKLSPEGTIICKSLQKFVTELLQSHLSLYFTLRTVYLSDLLTLAKDPSQMKMMIVIGFQHYVTGIPFLHGHSPR